ncbi:hypothetical protein GDR29_16095 [Xanthomonas oryzae pv. oryzae]|nr:hypothetical protein GDR29_16095 [Xanthomonas oryzae pv. oryzae]
MTTRCARNCSTGPLTRRACKSAWLRSDVYLRKNGTALLHWVDDMGADELPPTPSVAQELGSLRYL